jgi:hypothetical protein
MDTENTANGAGESSPAPDGSAWDRLMAFLADDSDMTPEQVRADLEAEGVDVDAFLARIRETVSRALYGSRRAGKGYAKAMQNAEAHGRRSRTVQPLVGQED